MFYLPRLFHHKWALPILAEFHLKGGGRFASLARILGANQGSVRQTLDILMASGWVVRDDQYGHPLRPEYLLTLPGRRVAFACSEVQEALSRTELDSVADSKWAPAVILACSGGPLRFGDVRDAIPEATDRAISQALKLAVSSGALARNVAVEAHPPTPWYSSTPAGRLASISLQFLNDSLTNA